MPVPSHLCWPVERLIIERVATLQEIETHYCTRDVLDRNEALDLWQAAQRRAQRRAEEKPR